MLFANSWRDLWWALSHPSFWSLPSVWAGPSDLLLMNLIWQTWWDDIANVRLHKDWLLFCLPSLGSMSWVTPWGALYGKKKKGFWPGRSWGPQSYGSWGTESSNICMSAFVSWCSFCRACPWDCSPALWVSFSQRHPSKLSPDSWLTDTVRS